MRAAPVANEHHPASRAALRPDLGAAATTIPDGDAAVVDGQLDTAKSVPAEAAGVVNTAVQTLMDHAPLLGMAARAFRGSLAMIISLLLLARVYAGAS